MRVLGVDTSLRSAGVGVVESRGSRMTAVEYNTISIPAAALLSECLGRLNRQITEIIDRAKPDAVAVEGVFFSKNIKTTLILGEARGAVIAACACKSLPVFEYSPRKIKQSVAGYGAAGKEQMRRMIGSLLGLPELPDEDAADALAIAICHLHNVTRYAAIAPKAI